MQRDTVSCEVLRVVGKSEQPTPPNEHFSADKAAEWHAEGEGLVLKGRQLYCWLKGSGHHGRSGRWGRRASVVG